MLVRRNCLSAAAALGVGEGIVERWFAAFDTADLPRRLDRLPRTPAGQEPGRYQPKLLRTAEATIARHRLLSFCMTGVKEPRTSVRAALREADSELLSLACAVTGR